MPPRRRADGRFVKGGRAPRKASRSRRTRTRRVKRGHTESLLNRAGDAAIVYGALLSDGGGSSEPVATALVRGQWRNATGNAMQNVPLIGNAPANALNRQQVAAGAAAKAGNWVAKKLGIRTKAHKLGRKLRVRLVG